MTPERLDEWIIFFKKYRWFGVIVVTLLPPASLFFASAIGEIGKRWAEQMFSSSPKANSEKIASPNLQDQRNALPSPKAKSTKNNPPITIEKTNELNSDPSSSTLNEKSGNTKPSSSLNRTSFGFKGLCHLPRNGFDPFRELLHGLIKAGMGKQEVGTAEASSSYPLRICGQRHGNYSQTYDTFARETKRKTGTRCITYENSKSKSRKNRNFRNPGFEQKPSHPVVCVSWLDAQAYVEWVSKKAQANYRLLTEAEWEYIARAGSSSSHHFGEEEERICEYANGSDLTTREHFDISGYHCDDGYAITAPAGSLKPNKLASIISTGT